MLQRGLNLTDGEVDALLAAVLRMAQSRRDAMLPQRGGLAPLVRVVNVHKPVEATLKYLVAYWPALAAARRVIGYLARHDAAAYVAPRTGARIETECVTRQVPLGALVAPRTGARIETNPPTRQCRVSPAGSTRTRATHPPAPIVPCWTRGWKSRC